MNVLPVIARELRAAARHPVNYWLRVLGAAALLAVAILAALDHGLTHQLGGKLFRSMDRVVFWGIWVFVPFITADCLSREKREGTLGLLFLTPLTALDIVLAKAIAHGLRALSLLVAVLPVTLIPFLMGGVSVTEATLAVVTNLSSFGLALAAGLVASARNKSRSSALAWTMVWAFLLFVIFCEVHGLALVWSIASTPQLAGRFWIPFDKLTITLWLMASFAMGTGYLVDWSDWHEPIMNRLGSAGLKHLLVAEFAVFGITILLTWFVVAFAARSVRRRWQGNFPSPWLVWWERKLCTPVLWLEFFRRWMRRKLERNPVGWLEQRTWSGRLITWSWLAVLVSIYSMALTESRLFDRAFNVLQALMALLLVLSLGWSAADSFRRERESGVLELLLVSPLNEATIIRGRVCGLWSQFAPAFALLVGVGLFLLRDFTAREDRPAMVAGLGWLAVTFLALPVIGLYFSLRCRSFVSAFLGTFAAGLVLPMVMHRLVCAQPFASLLIPFVGEESRVPVVAFALIIAVQIGLAVFLAGRLRTRLRRRSFAFQTTGG